MRPVIGGGRRRPPHQNVRLRQSCDACRGDPQLATQPTLSTTDNQSEVTWLLETDDGKTHALQHEPRIGCADFAAVRAAALAGLGIALLPDHTYRQALEDENLVRALPAWRGMKGLVRLVFTTRRGLPPAVRKFIDGLAAGFPKDALARWRADYLKMPGRLPRSAACQPDDGFMR